MYGIVQKQIEKTISEIREAGLYKSERVIESPQDARIEVADREVLNMCANNYLGLSDHPAIVETAHKALDEWGYGLSSLRFCCLKYAVIKQVVSRITDGLLEMEANGVSATYGSRILLPRHKRVGLVRYRGYRSPAVLRPGDGRKISHL